MLKRRHTDSTVFTFVVLVAIFLQWPGPTQAAGCRVQEIYRGFRVPYPPPTSSIPSEGTPEVLALKEEALLTEISQRPGHEKFPAAFKREMTTQRIPLSQRARLHWLNCIRHYIQQDSDGDGTGDWLALVDGRPSRVLVPLDPDFDGDGIPNIFDPAPFEKDKTASGGVTEGTGDFPQTIPAHLWLAADPADQKNQIQKDLFQRFHILAINQTDTHSPVVLRALIEFLETLPEHFTRSVNKLRYIYAYASHLRSSNISASFFPTTQSMSIGGESFYGQSLFSSREPLLRRIAHEYGHAVLFSRLTPRELARLASTYGHWPVSDVEPETFYASMFFESLSDPTQASDLPSSYAGENIHEWFAESFASYWMTMQGRRLIINRQSDSSATQTPKAPLDGLNQWLEKLIAETTQAATP